MAAFQSRLTFTHFHSKGSVELLFLNLPPMSAPHNLSSRRHEHSMTSSFTAPAALPLESTVNSNMDSEGEGLI